MENFSFTLQVAGVDVKKDDFEDVFYGRDCDDALVSVVNGVLLLDFDREAESYEIAVASATRDIEKIGGKVVKIERVYF
jgi:hypothetical protein